MLLEIKKITTTTTTTSVGYGLMRLSSRLLSESILRNPLPEASMNHYCPAGGERNYAMWLRGSYDGEARLLGH